MVVSDIVPVSSAQFQKTLASASPDVLREIIRELAQRMMDGEVGCGAVRGRARGRSGHPGRDNRNGDPEAGAGVIFSRRSWSTAAAPSGAPTVLLAT